MNTADIDYFRAISDKYRALTGIRETPAVRIPAGAFFEYGYYQFGVPSFSTPGWGLPAQAGPGGSRERAEPRAPEEAGPPGAAGPQPTGTASFDLRLLKWMDAEKIDGFVNWTHFKHPTLGDVEIGGFRPYAASNPPAGRMVELGRMHVEFIAYLSSLLPRVSIATTEVTALGAGLYRVKAEIENGGFLPTATAQGVLSRSVKPTMVQLEVDPASIVSGAPKTNFFQALAGSRRRQEYQWIVRAKPGSSVTLKVVSQKGGSDTAALTLK